MPQLIIIGEIVTATNLRGSSFGVGTAYGAFIPMAIRGQTTGLIRAMDANSYTHNTALTWGDTEVRWYNGLNANVQLNTANKAYNYVVFGRAIQH